VIVNPVASAIAGFGAVLRQRPAATEACADGKDRGGTALFGVDDNEDLGWMQVRRTYIGMGESCL
jgi:hypothetical protein